MIAFSSYMPRPLLRRSSYQIRPAFCRKAPYKIMATTNKMNTEEKVSSKGATNQTAEASSQKPTAYPPINPYHTGYLEVSRIHRVYYEISGNPSGIPVCFVHGGPGGGTMPSHRTFFDPEVYKIILFDQRGCGKSTPTACLEENTTWDLINDMELVREAAEVDQWMLFGGSWGSTLAVAYAQTHPNRVLAMILRGIFLMRQIEIEWLYERTGAAMLYPEAFELYVQGLPKELRNSKNLMHAYYSVLSRDEDSDERQVAARAWSKWEHTLSRFPRPDETEEEDKTKYTDDELLAFARIECHYFVNKGWLEEDGFLLEEEQMKKIRHMKTCIIHGRWDVVCPRTSAYELAEAFNGENVESILIELAGHSTFEPGMEEALLDASDRFGRELQWMTKPSST